MHSVGELRGLKHLSLASLPKSETPTLPLGTMESVLVSYRELILNDLLPSSPEVLWREDVTYVVSETGADAIHQFR